MKRSRCEPVVWSSRQSWVTTAGPAGQVTTANSRSASGDWVAALGFSENREGDGLTTLFCQIKSLANSKRAPDRPPVKGCGIKAEKANQEKIFNKPNAGKRSRLKH